MGSTNKTPNIGLNSWVGTDLIKREDFNTDNVIIDTKIKDSIDKIAILNGTGIIKEKANKEDLTNLNSSVNTKLAEMQSYLNYMPINGGNFDGSDNLNVTIDGGIY